MSAQSVFVPVRSNTSILQKLLEVMKDCGYIQKDKENTFHRYWYASEAAIKDKVHKSLVEHGVIPQFSLTGLTEREIPRQGKASEWLTTANVYYKFSCVDTGEFVEGTFYGCGVDPSDKGLYKAVTGAIKYILTSQFLIATGDDPENDEGRSASKEEKKGKQDDYVRSKGLEPYTTRPKGDVRTASEQHKALILEVSQTLDELPQSIAASIANPPLASIEMRQAAQVAGADAQLKEVAKPAKPRKITADSIEIRKGFSNMKEMLRTVTGDDTIYYDCLRSHGYASSAEIPTKEEGRKIYLQMGGIHKGLVEEQRIILELKHAREAYGQEPFMRVLGAHGAEAIEDVLNFSAEPLEALRKDLKALGGAA